MLVVCIIRCCSCGGSFDMYGCKANEAGEGHTLHIDDFVAANYAQMGSSNREFDYCVDGIAIACRPGGIDIRR